MTSPGQRRTNIYSPQISHWQQAKDINRFNEVRSRMWSLQGAWRTQTPAQCGLWITKTTSLELLAWLAGSLTKWHLCSLVVVTIYTILARTLWMLLLLSTSWDFDFPEIIILFTPWVLKPPSRMKHWSSQTIINMATLTFNWLVFPWYRFSHIFIPNFSVSGFMTFFFILDV